MKILVTGASGLLGSKVAGHLAGAPDCEVFGLARSSVAIPGVEFRHADLTDNAGLAAVLEDVKPQVIIHCAANVNLADCETNRDYTHALHVDATRTLAAAEGLEKLIYISTDSVFDGREGDYSEESIPHPLNYYAITKLQGEVAAMEAQDNTIVVRTNIYGLNEGALKGSLAEWALKNLGTDTAINGFDDVIFNPAGTNQLAGVLQTLAFSDYRGILNAGCSEAVSKFEFLRRMAAMLGKDAHLVRKASIADFPSAVQRPLNTSLNVDALNRHFGIRLSLEDGLRRLINDFKSTQ